MRDREGLVARIRQIRRVAAATDRSSATAAANADTPVIRTLEERIAHLEQMVEGLQDSVHRESERHEKRIADLEAQIQPAAMGAALDRDARRRGL
jgi:vacuolar-type H+-ATPase subunit I/STV1